MPPSKWQANTFYYQKWHNEYVIFNPLSGNTHLLGVAAANLLFTLQKGPADKISLAAAIATLLESGIDDDFMLEIDELLRQLNQLGLIVPI